MTKYLVKPENIKYKQELKEQSKTYYDIIKKEYNNKYINVFINCSFISNGLYNFIVDSSKYLNKYINIYLYKNNNIEYFITIYGSQYSINKLIDIIKHYHLVLNSSSQNLINIFALENNIGNYDVYY